MVVSHWSALGLCNELMTVVRRVASADSPCLGLGSVSLEHVGLGGAKVPSRGEMVP